MLSILIAAFAAPAIHAVEPGSVESFFRPSEFSQVTISPDGSRVAARHIGENYEMNLLLVDADSLVESNTPNVSMLTSFETGGVADYMWKNSERLLFRGQADIREEGASGGNFVAAYSIGIDGSQPRTFLTRYCQTAGARGQGCYTVNENRDYVAFNYQSILDRQGDDDQYVILSMNPSMASPYADVFRLDTRSGRINKVEDSPGTFMQWFADSNHQRRAAVSHVRGSLMMQLMYRETEDDEWRSVYEFEAQEAQVFGFDTDNQHIIILSRRDTDKFSVYRLNPDTGQTGDPIISDPIYDIETIRFTGNRDQQRSIAWAETRGDTPRKYFMNEEIQGVQETIDYYFPDTINDLVSWDDDRNRFIVHAWNDRQPGRYYLLDMEAGKLRFLFDQRPWQNPEEQGEMRTIEYTARDGLLIRGYITLPPGYVDGEPVPLILNPHGGPYGPRDEYGWAREAQFFASRGWATLQVNYRGSGGYGRHFETSPYRQWGLQMQDDLTDAVQWAVEQGFTSEDRMCIYGASYGGYATLQALVSTPDLFQCGVSYVAVSSLTALLDLDTRRSTAEFRDTFMGTVMTRYLGDASNDADMERLRATSPLYHVENIEVPLLAIHGEADPRVDIDTQFYPLVRELRSQDKDFEQIVGAYEGHGFFTGEVTIDLYTRMAEFLSRHLD
jgi:dipeptidyl aminopeptidase/acylaminoacyl peptidase